MLSQGARKHITRLVALKSAYEVVKDPHKTEEILNLSDALALLAEDEDIALFAEELCRDPKGLEAVESRYRVGPVDLSAFSKFPEGTLGRAYFEHLARNQISPATLRVPEVKDDLSYVRAHITETHDIWHAVTGFGTDVAGELGLAAFSSVQLSSQFEYLLVAGGLLNTVFYEFSRRRERMDAIVKGWNMGKDAVRLFGVRWSELWREDIHELRRRLKIKTA